MSTTYEMLARFAQSAGTVYCFLLFIAVPAYAPLSGEPAGKGGVVRRLGWALDPRSFKVAATPPRVGW